MSQTFNSSRLVLARRRRGLTRTTLAEDSSIALRTIVSYETQAREPSPETIARFAETLRFPVEFFYGPTLEGPPLSGTSFRALSNLTARQRHQALAAGTLALSLSDWITARFETPDPTIPTYTGVDPELASIAVRSEWSLGELPIANTIHLLEVHGVRVFSVSEENAHLDAFSFWRRDIPYVFLNNMKSAERTRMDAAHELGHLVLHSKEGAQGRQAEMEASMFASAFLMPRGSVLAEAPKNGTLRQLIEAKRRWNVSVAGLAYRMHKLGLLTDWQYRKLFIDMGRDGYRTDEPNSAPSESSQVLTKVFTALREKGMPMAHVAEGLLITTEELSTLVFGLVLTSVPRS